MLRARLVFAGLSLFVGLAAAAACGLDESGTSPDGSADVNVGDVQPDGPADVVIDVPQACTTLDTSACVDAAIPPGWTFAAIALSAQSCPSPAYAPSAYVFGPTPTSGACGCSCSLQGDYTCAGTLTAGGNNAGCGGTLTLDAGPDGCVDTGWTDHHATVDWAPTATGSPTCDASASGDGGWTASAATACTPGCDASDFCSLTTPFMRCIVSATATDCPTQGFTAKQVALGQSASVTCPACGCGVSPPPACNGTVVAHDGTGCTGTHDFTLDTSCTDTGHAFASLSYAAVPASTTTCSVTDAGAPSASLGGSITVCCMP